MVERTSCALNNKKGRFRNYLDLKIESYYLAEKKQNGTERESQLSDVSRRGFRSIINFSLSARRLHVNRDNERESCALKLGKKISSSHFIKALPYVYSRAFSHFFYPSLTICCPFLSFWLTLKPIFFFFSFSFCISHKLK